MLDTTLSDAERYPLKLHDFMVMNLTPEVAPMQVAWGSGKDQRIGNELPVVGFSGDHYLRPMYISKDWTAYTGSVMAIDPAGRGADEIGYAVVKIANGLLFITAVGGLRGGYTPENLARLAAVAKYNQVNEVIVESNFGDGMFTELCKPIFATIHPCAINEVRSTGQKELRIIDTLEPVLNQHRLVLDEKIIEQDSKVEEPEYQLLYQLTRITRERGALRHDDRLDALAIAVKFWVEAMARDTNKAVSDSREKAMEDELKKFMDQFHRQHGGSIEDSCLHLPPQLG
jgi:hypothetical protein